MTEDILDAAETVLPETVTEQFYRLTVWQKFLDDLPSKAFGFALQVIFALVFFFVGVKIISVVRKVFQASIQKANVDKGIAQFLDSCLKIGLYVVLVFLIAAGFGLNTATVAAVLGSAGVAISLAVQGSLSNFAGGVLILLAKPFSVGDYIITSGAEGKVFKIDVFYTKLLTLDNKVVILPNGPLSNTQITNVTAMDKRKVIWTMGISYNSDIKKAKEILLETISSCPLVLHDEEKKVSVEELADSSVNMRLEFWAPTSSFLATKFAVVEAVKLALDANGIEIPFPQMDVHLDK